MTKHTYEIEIKSLLGDDINAQNLKKKMKSSDPKLYKIAKNKQLNHYFIDGQPDKLLDLVKQYVPEDSHEKLEHILTDGKELSIRTRLLDDTVLFVVKASISDDSSSNGVMRIEYEEPVNDLTLDQLDKILIDAGYSYQAKWSREREEYKYKGTNVCIDRNAGYGYLAEFERVIDDEGNAEDAKNQLHQLMHDLDVIELSQDRLERMFEFYNNNWEDYYGTDKIFVIE